MRIRWRGLELPSRVICNRETLTDTFGEFHVEPFERGFGHTVGNALRRILLSSLESPAIISVRIEGVPHEYMAVEGIIEDMTHIILNLKGALLRKIPSDDEAHSREPKTVSKIIDITPDLLE